MKYTAKQIKQISEGEPSEIAQFITALLVQIDQLEARVNELERQVGTNSRNSSKPSSSDGFRKTTSLRQPVGKKGAPKGHKGNTLKMADTPDQVEWHEPVACGHCQSSLTDAPIKSH